MGVGLIGGSVELQVHQSESGILGAPAKPRILGEEYPIGGALDAKIANLSGVADGLQEMGTEGGLAAAELNAHLAARLNGQRVIEDLLDVFPVELVDVSYLIGIHEARVAHHVAAIGQVHGQNRASPVLDAGASVAP